MKFTPKTLTGNVNVSKGHPLKELLWLAGGLILIIGALFLLLGALTDWAVSRTSPEIETWLGNRALKQFPAKPDRQLQERLDSIVGLLPHDSAVSSYQFTAYRGLSDEINAIALPGGNIIVYDGLLKQVESENELTMILGHELGHFAHRDHLRGLGRGMGLAIAATLLFGFDNPAGDLVSNTVLSYQAKYSQAQEESADLFGLELLVAKYSHAAGATAFFQRVSQNAGSKASYFLASHPHPGKRVEELNKRMSKLGYKVGVVEPLTISQ